MTENKKPEWFEIAENDGPVVPQKASKTVPLAAILAATLIIGIGAVVAQTQEEPLANAIEATQTQASAHPVAANLKAISPTTSSATHRVKAPAIKVPVANNSVGLQNPSIAKLPTKGAENEHEGREGHGNHENNEGDND